ncbi:MAG: hypothetical protein A3G33_11310 [Omnitrophica bacterium RIFCSPLOWO2_12_FULL_44_17]|uniref:GGDEF domain-containing protein n=1 Tax=Candidatus Danuiimicrobium aquiferis TaxID=1801832 RepID=A0A1G1KRY7_9BACT|nr:MAG: hypothetical protein A3B72_09145 [Omnitrophica bacterium RIFCSPHIGHO2_02_FULL_45_28]OGW88341.1 MAG: hypothetical protein A3E74_10535 [Omnitrophica bacterium RIFCSPHIGHO2_12_FULL_44_12]OGW95582.1 MAG: hypothetical protein A3G33_11310 [Omnitrophica bacterium RIFCSPLOWO2_12_FULL_44_17]OGX03703.1 MAG: hypothetical protein A3J12_01180 [Omnitrophica bacterium RIFCSPLOWO2_02_FULL_44_11]
MEFWNEDTQSQWYIKMMLRDEMMKKTEGFLKQMVSTDCALRQIGSSLIEVCGVSHAAVLEFRPRTQDYRVRMSWGKFRLPQNLVKADISSELVHESSRANISNPENNLNLKHILKLHGTEFEFMLRKSGHLYGMFFIGPPAEGGHYSQEMVNHFEQLADQIGLMFEVEYRCREASKDPLKNDYHYQFLEDSFGLLCRQFKKTKGPCAVAVIIINDEEAIRLRYGDTMADLCIQMISEKIQKNIRTTDSFIRYAPGKFCIAFCEMYDWNGGSAHSAYMNVLFMDLVQKIAKRIQSDLMEDQIEWRAEKLNIAVSLGIAPLNSNPENSELETEMSGKVNQLEEQLSQLGKNQIYMDGEDSGTNFMDFI